MARDRDKDRAGEREPERHDERDGRGPDRQRKRPEQAPPSRLAAARRRAVAPVSATRTAAYSGEDEANALAGRYVLKQFYARGGMGEVWIAEDLQIGRQVALKKLRPERYDQHERFFVEAQIAGQLEHPGVVPVHDVGMDNEGIPFYVMKFVAGTTLKAAIEDYHAWSKESPVPREVQWLRLLGVFIDLCQTLGYAHSRGALHRDVKPDNVMLGLFGETLVIDWGLAKSVDEPDVPADPSHVRVPSSGSSVGTVAGSLLGTPTYMAPEVAEGRIADVDETTDVYLLGATLYEILTGHPPRCGGSQTEIVALARTTPPRAPRKLNPKAPRALEAICMKAMAHGRRHRYESAMALAEDVQRYLAGEPVSAYPEGPIARVCRSCRITGG